MTDFDFWKKQYQETWSQSSQRETAIAAYLAQESGKSIVPVGLGAGSADYLPGSAIARGHAKGDADLMVVHTNIYLEVTGPLVSSVDDRQDLWIRPDKVQNARQNRTSHEVWIVHHLPKSDLIRVVPLGVEFWTALDGGSFPIVTPRIRGVQERYHSVPASHSCVKPCSVLIGRLKKA